MRTYRDHAKLLERLEELEGVLRELTGTCESILEKSTGNDLPLGDHDYQELKTATETAREVLEDGS